MTKGNRIEDGRLYEYAVPMKGVAFAVHGLSCGVPRGLCEMCKMTGWQ